jgi:hypothetical protein
MPDSGPAPNGARVAAKVVRVVSADDRVQDLFEQEMERLGDLGPLPQVRVKRSTTLGHAHAALAKTRPDLVILDPDTPRGEPRNSPRGVKELLAEIGSAVPVLLALMDSDQDWAGQVIRQSNFLVWDWGSPACRLEDLLAQLLDPLPRRQLSVVVRLGRYEPVCDIDLGGKALFRDLRLSPGPQFKLDWSANDLQSIADMADRPAAWRSLVATGNALFRDTLDKIGDALLEAGDAGAALDIRFEIHADDIDRMFSMPIELLNRDSRWDRFFCRIAPMARRVPARGIHRCCAPPAQSHVLYIDAGATRGAMPVISSTGEVAQVAFPDLSGAVSAERRSLEALAPACLLELLQPTQDVSLKDRLRQRLREPDYVADVIHFTGHAITPAFGATELVLPSLQKGKVDRLSIQEFATWLPEGVRLVVLSACQGISVDTARRLHAEKGIAVLGFRWRVEADAAADFVANFYAAHLRERLPVAAAYQLACAQGNATQLAWAAAVLMNHD